MDSEVSALIGRLREGDRAALDELMPIVYQELHRIASSYLSAERANQTLQPTALHGLTHDP